MTCTTTSPGPACGVATVSSCIASRGSPSRSGRITQARMLAGTSVMALACPLASRNALHDELPAGGLDAPPARDAVGGAEPTPLQLAAEAPHGRVVGRDVL